jgi:WD40 repeat protein
MEKSQESIEPTKKSRNSSVTFYSIIFLKDIAITSGSDGYLYLWNSKNLIKKQNANPKAAILTLFASKNSKIFASGAVDGKANIWQLGSSSIIQKVYEFSLYSGKEAFIPTKYHIQSVVIGTN